MEGAGSSGSRGLLATPDQVRRALYRRFMSATVTGPGSPLVTSYPDVAAEVAMSVVGPVLEAMAGEIARLTAAREPSPLDPPQPGPDRGGIPPKPRRDRKKSRWNSWPSA